MSWYQVRTGLGSSCYQPFTPKLHLAILILVQFQPKCLWSHVLVFWPWFWCLFLFVAIVLYSFLCGHPQWKLYYSLCWRLVLIQVGRKCKCVLCDHTFVESLCSRNTYCHYMSPTCYFCENMFLMPIGFGVTCETTCGPHVLFCISCPECGKIFIRIVMWTNLFNDLCILVILLIDVHV